MRILISIILISTLFIWSPIFAQESITAEGIESVNFYYPKNAYHFKVSDDIEGYIEGLKGFMDSNEAFTVKLDGYSQDGKNDAWNTRVSKYRVRAVRDFLIDYGINKERIQIEYFGKTNHISKDDSNRELAKNRRVELRVVQQG